MSTIENENEQNIESEEIEALESEEDSADENAEGEESVVAASDGEKKEGEAGDKKHNHKEDKRPAWVQKRLNELAGQRDAATQQLAQYQKSNEELLAKLAAANTDQTSATNVADIHKLAEEKAKQIVAQQMAAKAFNDAADRAWNDGLEEFPDFKEAVDNLNNSFGDKFNQAVPTLIDALPKQSHKVIHYLGHNLDEADRIFSMSFARQIAELTKLELKISKPKATKEISKAPAPIKIVEGKANPTPSLANTKSTAEWIELREKQLKASGKTNLL